MKNKLKNIYLPILLFIILLLGMAYFQYIPAKLLKINLETISTTSKIIYSIICDALFMLFVYLLYRKTINKNFKDFGDYTITSAVCDGKKLPVSEESYLIFPKESISNLSDEPHKIIITLA